MRHGTTGGTVNSAAGNDDRIRRRAVDDFLLPGLVSLLRSLRYRFWSTAQGRERRYLLCLLSWPVIRLAWWREKREIRVAILDQLSVCLHEPRSRCRGLLTGHHRHLLLLEERRDRWQTGPEIACRRRRVVWPEEQAWRSALARDRRSRIMAACHVGDYVHCLPRLASVEPGGRDRILLRHEAGSPGAMANMRESYRQSGLSTPEIMLAAETSPLALRQRLRRGACTLTTFCDLPQQFGVPVQADFLGLPAWFCSGPAQLAVSAGVPVVPVHVRPDAAISRIVLSPAIDPSHWRGLGYEDAVRLVTGRLAAHLERLLFEMPQHWRYLSVLPRYFTPPD
jgi:hypothetical protein